MPLREEDLEQVAAHVKAHLGEWVMEQRLGRPLDLYEIEMRERIVRVEEELKHQRELMREGFEQMERRFEQMERRFEQMERRFEQMERRFEQLTQRIDRFMVWSFGVTMGAAGLVIAVLKWS